MTTPVSSLITQIISKELNLAYGEGNQAHIKLNNGKEYTISISDGIVTSANRKREGLWDKIKSAVCDFFGTSTSKRLVEAYNRLVDKKVNPNDIVLDNGVKVVQSSPYDFMVNLTGIDSGVRRYTLTVNDVKDILKINEVLTKNCHRADITIEGNTITYEGIFLYEI